MEDTWEEGGEEVGAERKAQDGEMLLTLAIGWWASAVRGEEAGCFRKVAGVSIVVADGLCSVTDILTQ